MVVVVWRNWGFRLPCFRDRPLEAFLQPQGFRLTGKAGGGGAAAGVTAGDFWQGITTARLTERLKVLANTADGHSPGPLGERTANKDFLYVSNN